MPRQGLQQVSARALLPTSKTVGKIRIDELCVSKDIERWSDRFKPKTATAAQAAIRLQQVHQARQYDRDLHPPAVFDAVMEKKRKTKGGESESRLPR